MDLGIRSFSSISKESTQATMMNELLDFVLKLNTFLYVMVEIPMMEAIFVLVSSIWLG